MDRITACTYCSTELDRRQVSKRARFCSRSCASRHNNKHRDPNFLDYSEELKHYLIGLIWTDGCLSQQEGKSERITIALKDLGLISKLHPIVCPNRKIYINKPRKETHSPSYAIVTMSEEVIIYLKDKGLEPRKSKTLKYPDIDDKFFPDFLRGVIDGDGSVFLNRVNGHTYKHVSITSASDAFLEGLKKQIERFGFTPTIVRDVRGHVSYIKLYKKDEILRLCDLIYGHNPDFYLERKKSIFYKDIV